jgi:hypothetical protein
MRRRESWVAGYWPSATRARHFWMLFHSPYRLTCNLQHILMCAHEHLDVVWIGNENDLCFARGHRRLSSADSQTQGMRQ